jgi:hypothetical protein
MYKSLLKHILTKKQEEELFYSNLHKNIGKKPDSVLNKMPHFIFSAEQPRYPRKSQMGHEDTLQLLRDKGYHVDEIKGKYGDEEKSILVHNPPQKSIKHLHNLAQSLGQENSIYSDGYNHEMHFHHGDNAGQHLKGQGTNFHKQQPENYYSTLADGSHFQHNFDWDNYYPKEESQLKMKPIKINKSESRSNRVYLRKNEDDHPLKDQDPETKLIHYSPKMGLNELDPSHHGIRGIGSEAKRARPEHPMSFFYLERTKPERVVTSGSKSKYISKLGDKKLYDIGKDHEDMFSKAKEIANQRQTNPGVVRTEDLHGAIRDAGYHGIYNSGLDNTMRNVVGMFEKMPVEKEYPIHPNDFREASSFNHHSHKEVQDRANNFYKENGSHNPKFLARLETVMKRGKKDGR